MNKTQFNRTVVILCFFALCGWIGFLCRETPSLGEKLIAAILGPAGMLALNYVTIKGQGK